MTMQNLEAAEVARIHIQRGDVLMVQHPSLLSALQQDTIEALIKKAFVAAGTAAPSILILPYGTVVSVMSKEAA